MVKIVVVSGSSSSSSIQCWLGQHLESTGSVQSPQHSLLVSSKQLHVVKSALISKKCFNITVLNQQFGSKWP